MTSVHHFLVVGRLYLRSTCPNAADIRLRLSSLRLLLEHTSVLSSYPCVLVLRQGETEGDAKVFTKADRGHFLAVKLLDALWCLPGVKVTMSKLANIIGSPRVTGSRSRDHSSQTSTGYSEVLDVEDFGTLDAMWRVKLSKSAFSPDIQLAIGTKGG